MANPISLIPKNASPRAAALSARDFALAMPNLNAARTSACGLEKFVNTLLIRLVEWRSGFGWRAGGSLFAGLLSS